MSTRDDDLKPPSYLDDEIPLPDDEWMASSSSMPTDDVPPPDDAWMPSSASPQSPPPEAWDGPSSAQRSGSAPGGRSTAKQPRAGKASGPSSSTDGERAFGKGVEVKIIGGKEGVGVVGEIFWWGNSKYGEGMRAGVKGEGDTSYWVGEADLGWPDDDVPDEVLEAVAAMPDMGKGDRVRVTQGRDSGKEGRIFWWGESRYGDGMRAGIETDDGETVWSDASALEKVGTPEVSDADDDIPF